MKKTSVKEKSKRRSSQKEVCPKCGYHSVMYVKNAECPLCKQCRHCGRSVGKCRCIEGE